MNRTNAVLAALLVAQVGFILWSRAAPDAHEVKRTIDGQHLFPDASAETLVRFEIARDGRRTIVAKKAGALGEWVVESEGGLKADQVAARAVADALGRMKPGRIVAQNPALHEEMGVAGADAIAVRAADASGRTVAEFVLGNTTANWSGVYARVPPSTDDVMLIEDNVRHVFDRGEGRVGAWRDKTVLSGDAAALRRIELQPAEGEAIVLERDVAGEAPADDDPWRLTMPLEGPVNRYTAKSMVATLTDLEAEAIHAGTDTLADLGLEPPAVRATATFADGRTLVLEVGREEGENRFARVPGTPDVFLVAAHKLFNFARPAAELVERTAGEDGAGDQKGAEEDGGD